MSTGRIVSYTGFAVLAAAVILSALILVTGPRSKRRIRERMKEKY